MSARAAAERAARAARRAQEEASAEAVVSAWLRRGLLTSGRHLAAHLYGSNAGRVYTIEPKALSVNNSPTMGDAIDRLRAVRVAAEAAIASNSGTLTAVIDGAPVRLLDAALTTTGVVGWPAE